MSTEEKKEINFINKTPREIYNSFSKISKNDTKTNQIKKYKESIEVLLPTNEKEKREIQSKQLKIVGLFSGLDEMLKIETREEDDVKDTMEVIMDLFLPKKDNKFNNKSIFNILQKGNRTTITTIQDLNEMLKPGGFNKLIEYYGIKNDSEEYKILKTFILNIKTKINKNEIFKKVWMEKIKENGYSGTEEDFKEDLEKDFKTEEKKETEEIEETKETEIKDLINKINNYEINNKQLLEEIIMVSKGLNQDKIISMIIPILMKYKVGYEEIIEELKQGTQKEENIGFLLKTLKDEEVKQEEEEEEEEEEAGIENQLEEAGIENQIKELEIYILGKYIKIKEYIDIVNEHNKKTKDIQMKYPETKEEVERLIKNEQLLNILRIYIREEVGIYNYINNEITIPQKNQEIAIKQNNDEEPNQKSNGYKK